MSREAHVRLCEGLGVKFPRSTHPYIPTGEGWLYFAGIKDLCSKKIVGFSLSPRMDIVLVANALHKAFRTHRPLPGLILHSDRGSQYCVVTLIRKT